MQKEEVKIFVFSRGRFISSMILSGIFVAMGVILFFFQYVVAILSIVIAMIFLLGPLSPSSFWAVFSDNSLEIQNVFGKQKKKEDWRNLSSVYIRILWGGRMCDSFFVLNFSEKEEEFIQYNDAWQTDHILLFMYNAKNEELLKRYTDVPIIDKRSRKKE